MPDADICHQKMGQRVVEEGDSEAGLHRQNRKSLQGHEFRTET